MRKKAGNAFTPRRCHPPVLPADRRSPLLPQRIEQLAREAGVVRRKARKLGPCDLLGELIAQCPHGSPSYNDLASGIEGAHGQDPSRQAAAQRLNEAFESFLETLLGEVIAMKISEDVEAGKLAPGDFRGCRRVLARDSAVIKLPAALSESFSGVANAHSRGFATRASRRFTI